MSIEAERRAARNWMLLIAFGVPLIILGYYLLGQGCWVAAVILGLPMAISVWPLRQRLGID